MKKNTVMLHLSPSSVRLNKPHKLTLESKSQPTDLWPLHVGGLQAL